MNTIKIVTMALRMLQGQPVRLGALSMVQLDELLAVVALLREESGK